MTTNITEYPNVMERLNEFGCNVPIGIALLPVNFETADSVEELRQVTEGATVKTLLRSANLPIIDIFPPEKRPPYIQNNAFDWLAPPLLIPLAIISQNPHVVDIALNVIANHISEFFSGLSEEKKIKLDVIVETPGSNGFKKISYEGNVAGLKEVANVVKAINDES